MSDLSHISSAAAQTARREIAALHRLLKSDEQVQDICHGSDDQGRTAVLVVTDRRVVYLQRRRLWGTHVEAVPLARVRTADAHAGIRHATVKVDAGGRVFVLVDVDRALARVFCERVLRLTQPPDAGYDPERCN